MPPRAQQPHPREMFLVDIGDGVGNACIQRGLAEDMRIICESDGDRAELKRIVLGPADPACPQLFVVGWWYVVLSQDEPVGLAFKARRDAERLAAKPAYASATIVLYRESEVV